MNNRLKVMLSVLIWVISCSLSVEARPFYVVIGTFSEQGSARRFATSLADVFPSASFKFDSGRNVYHVYVLETSRHDEAENLRHVLQTANGFADAWIFTDFNSGEATVEGGMPSSDDYKKLELFTGGAIMLGSGDKSNFSIRDNKTDIRETIREGSGKAFTFMAVTRSGRTMPAQVLLMSNGKAMSSFPTGEVIAFGGKGQSHILTLVCEVPGFNTETKIIDLGNLANTRGIKKNDDGVWEVRFPITKVKVNEINLLYRDMFYSDAAVLQPSSKKQIDLLQSLLKSNRGWKIVINSHCNVGVKRDIILPGKEKNYFDLTEAVNRNGNDRQLTGIRAGAIRDYLVDHGIDSKRIAEMGWGSLNLLVSSTAEDANMNERIEIVLVF